MYFPYFRGKQYELITIRENAGLLARANFVPVIEPVKATLNGLTRALDEVGTAGGSTVVIVNPYHGDHADDGHQIIEMLRSGAFGGTDISPGILLRENCDTAEALSYIGAFPDEMVTLIHAGFTDGARLADRLGARLNNSRQIFYDSVGLLYRRHFRNGERILLHDGFVRRRNRDHPAVEFFSDLHITYLDAGMDGFGDFLTVGDDFSEGGGPAYAIAIHLTYIDRQQEDMMFIRHFLSTRQDTPTDPAGKFMEALEQMMAHLEAPGCQILETGAVRAFRDLYRERHYPGLGFVKKLSMQHHLETLADYLG